MELIILIIALHLGFLIGRALLSTIFLSLVWVGQQIIKLFKTNHSVNYTPEVDTKIQPEVKTQDMLINEFRRKYNG